MIGKCLCGVIEFIVEEIFDMVFNCYCLKCRILYGVDYVI